MATMIRLVGLCGLVCLLAAGSQARPEGAPVGTCFDLKPGHNQKPPEPNNGDYVLTTNNVAEGIEVTLRTNKTSASLFRGFVVRAETTNVNMGNFTNLNADTQKLTCFNQKYKAVTHTANNEKDSVSMMWEPGAEDGDVKFQATVVVNFDRHFENIMGQPEEDTL